jgi:hypothetical protein
MALCVHLPSGNLLIYFCRDPVRFGRCNPAEASNVFVFVLFLCLFFCFVPESIKPERARSCGHPFPYLERRYFPMLGLARISRSKLYVLPPITSPSTFLPSVNPMALGAHLLSVRPLGEVLQGHRSIRWLGMCGHQIFFVFVVFG